MEIYSLSAVSTSFPKLRHNPFYGLMPRFKFSFEALFLTLKVLRALLHRTKNRYIFFCPKNWSMYLRRIFLKNPLSEREKKSEKSPSGKQKNIVSFRIRLCHKWSRELGQCKCDNFCDTRNGAFVLLLATKGYALEVLKAMMSEFDTKLQCHGSHAKLLKEVSMRVKALKKIRDFLEEIFGLQNEDHEKIDPYELAKIR